MCMVIAPLYQALKRCIVTIRSDCPGCNLLSRQLPPGKVNFYGVKPATTGQPSCCCLGQLLRTLLLQVNPAVTGYVSCYRAQASLQGQASSHRLDSTTAAPKSLTFQLAVFGATAGCAAAF